MEEERTRIKKLNQDRFYIYRRSKSEEKKLDKSTNKLKRFCGYQTDKEKNDEKITSTIMINLSNLQL